MDYHLKPMGRTCAATGEPLAPGSVCHSVLIERNGELLRIDYSVEGWNGPPEGVLGHWQCVVPHAAEPKARPFDTEALMRYFEQLSEDPSPAQEKFRYVIALLLLQKRRLRLEGSRMEGEIEYLQVVGSQSEGPFEVRDHTLADDEIERMQQDLNARLATEWS